MKFSWDPVNVASLLYVFCHNWSHWILWLGPKRAAGRAKPDGGQGARGGHRGIHQRLNNDITSLS